jgi:hypothetical protein
MTNELEKVINEYRLFAQNHGRATLDGESAQANINYDRIIESLHKIRQFGNEGNVALLLLTEDADQSVRCWAATHSLNYNERKAKEILKKLSKGKGIIAFDAKIILNEWKKGTLKLP